MSNRNNSYAPRKKPVRSKKRRLGESKHRFSEAMARDIADADIAKDFEDSALWPDA
jgi:hypothetical protein